MQVIKATGLVPVRALVATQHRVGAIFGVTPAKAREGIINKEVALVAVPPGIETYEVADPVSPPAPAPVVEDVIEIPDGWDRPYGQGGLQWMQVVQLAEKISGHRLVVPTGRKPVDIARELIQSEIERRAAASSPPQAQA